MKKAKEGRIGKTQFKRLMKEKGWITDKNVFMFFKDGKVIAAVVRKHELIQLPKNQKIVLKALMNSGIKCYKYCYGRDHSGFFLLNDNSPKNS